MRATRYVLAFALLAAPAAATMSERLDEAAMEMMRDPDRRAEMSKPLDPAEVEKLEKKLVEKPDHVESRLRLMNHYRMDRSPEARAAQLKHLFWVVENGPEASIATRGVFVSKARDAEAYTKLRDLWLKHLEDNPKNAKIAANAASFFGTDDRAKAEELLKKAQELEPKNRSWTQQLAGLYMRAAQDRQSPDPNGAKNALAQYESLLAEADERMKPSLLTQAAEAALLAGDDAKVSKLAAELLKATSPDDRNYGDHVHNGHRFLGHAALKAGDVATAKAELAKAGKAPASMMMERAGPSLTLAKALLEKGEKDAVLAYLEDVAELWPTGVDTVDQWIDQIKKGETPELDNRRARFGPGGAGGPGGPGPGTVVIERSGSAPPPQP